MKQHTQEDSPYFEIYNRKTFSPYFQQNTILTTPILNGSRWLVSCLSKGVEFEVSHCLDYRIYDLAFSKASCNPAGFLPPAVA